jgi:cytochrome c-type biogenesis protein CcmH/NrfG
MPRVRPGTLAHVVALTLAVVLTYAGSLDGAYVSDDFVAVRDNPQMRSLSLANVRSIFTTFDGANYAPIKVLSLAVDERLWGPGPRGHHVMNLLIHVACTLVVYAILRRLALAPLAACLAAGLWALHPLQVESVAWISERKNVLAGLFFFAAFFAYLEYSERPRAVWYVGFLTLFALALLTKLNTMVLPAVCLAYETTFRGRLRRRDVLAAIPPLGLGVLVAWYTLAGNPIHGGVWHGGSMLVTWLSTAPVVVRYVGHALWPVDLGPWYEVPLRGSPLDPPVLLSLVALVALAGITVWAVHRRRPEAFWVLWFLITLAPMLNVVVPGRSMMNDRFMHLALLGPIALLASALGGLWSVAARRAAAVGAVAVACAYAVLSMRLIPIWADPVSLWGAMARAPLVGADPVVHVPDRDARLAHLRRALAADPSSGVLHNNLGAQYYEMGRLDDALDALETAGRMAPEDGVVALNLGRVLRRLGRPAEAEAALTRAVALRPYEFLPRLELARLHLQAGDAARARAALDAALRVQPTAFAHQSVRAERQALARLEARPAP